MDDRAARLLSRDILPAVTKPRFAEHEQRRFRLPTCLGGAPRIVQSSPQPPPPPARPPQPPRAQPPRPPQPDPVIAASKVPPKREDTAMWFRAGDELADAAVADELAPERRRPVFAIALAAAATAFSVLAVFALR